MTGLRLVLEMPRRRIGRNLKLGREGFPDSSEGTFGVHRARQRVGVCHVPRQICEGDAPCAWIAPQAGRYRDVLPSARSPDSINSRAALSFVATSGMGSSWVCIAVRSVARGHFFSSRSCRFGPIGSLWLDTFVRFRNVIR